MGRNPDLVLERGGDANWRLFALIIGPACQPRLDFEGGLGSNADPDLGSRSAFGAAFSRVSTSQDSGAADTNSGRRSGRKSR